MKLFNVCIATLLSAASAAKWSATMVQGNKVRAVVDTPYLDAVLSHSLPGDRAKHVEVPLPDGTTRRYVLRDVSVMDEALAAKYPEFVTLFGDEVGVVDGLRSPFKGEVTSITVTYGGRHGLNIDVLSNVQGSMHVRSVKSNEATTTVVGEFSFQPNEAADSIHDEVSLSSGPVNQGRTLGDAEKDAPVSQFVRNRLRALQTCDVDSIGDGVCNVSNNNALCGFDGGDCCAKVGEGGCDALFGSFDCRCKDPAHKTETAINYRLVLAATPSYTAKLGGSTQATMFSMVAIANRVGNLFRRDLGFGFILVDGTDKLIHTGSNGNGMNSFLEEMDTFVVSSLTDKINGVVGAGTYDIGHVLKGNVMAMHDGFFGEVCEESAKAEGVTGHRYVSPYGFEANASGNEFMNIVARNIAVQFGATSKYYSCVSPYPTPSGDALHEGCEKSFGNPAAFLGTNGLEQIRRVIKNPFRGGRCGVVNDNPETVDRAIVQPIMDMESPSSRVCHVPSYTAFRLEAQNVAQKEGVVYTWGQVIPPGIDNENEQILVAEQHEPAEVAEPVRVPSQPYNQARDHYMLRPNNKLHFQLTTRTNYVKPQDLDYTQYGPMSIGASFSGDSVSVETVDTNPLKILNVNGVPEGGDYANVYRNGVNTMQVEYPAAFDFVEYRLKFIYAVYDAGMYRFVESVQKSGIQHGDTRVEFSGDFGEDVCYGNPYGWVAIESLTSTGCSFYAVQQAQFLCEGNAPPTGNSTWSPTSTTPSPTYTAGTAAPSMSPSTSPPYAPSPPPTLVCMEYNKTSVRHHVVSGKQVTMPQTSGWVVGDNSGNWTAPTPSPWWGTNAPTTWWNSATPTASPVFHNGTEAPSPSWNWTDAPTAWWNATDTPTQAPLNERFVSGNGSIYLGDDYMKHIIYVEQQPGQVASITIDFLSGMRCVAEDVTGTVLRVFWGARYFSNSQPVSVQANEYLKLECTVTDEMYGNAQIHYGTQGQVEAPYQFAAYNVMAERKFVGYSNQQQVIQVFPHDSSTSLGRELELFIEMYDLDTEVIVVNGSNVSSLQGVKASDIVAVYRPEQSESPLTSKFPTTTVYPYYPASTFAVPKEDVTVFVTTYSSNDTLFDADRCVDYPLGWYDSDGDAYGCTNYYVTEDACLGAGHAYENQGTVANEACCNCGGGASVDKAHVRLTLSHDVAFDLPLVDMVGCTIMSVDDLKLAPIPYTQLYAVDIGTFGNDTHRVTVEIIDVEMRENEFAAMFVLPFTLEEYIEVVQDPQDLPSVAFESGQSITVIGDKVTAIVQVWGVNGTETFDAIDGLLKITIESTFEFANRGSVSAGRSKTVGSFAGSRITDSQTTWVVESTDSDALVVDFKVFDLENGVDKVKVFKGESMSEDDLMREYTGSYVPMPLTVEDSKVTIVLEQDDSDVGMFMGFKAEVSPAGAQKQGEATNIGLIVGVAVGCAALLVGAAVIVKKKSGTSQALPVARAMSTKMDTPEVGDMVTTNPLFTTEKQVEA